MRLPYNSLRCPKSKIATLCALRDLRVRILSGIRNPKLPSFLCDLRGLRVRSSLRQPHPYATSPRLRTRATAAKSKSEIPSPAYGLGAPGIVFGRVAKWTISPTSGTNQPSTTTRVRFGDWRRFESFMIQIAIQSQMASPITSGINIIPKQPATSPAACPSVSWVGVGEASSCARRVAAVKRNGRPEISRFIGR
jgi:hypothetical protein